MNDKKLDKFCTICGDKANGFNFNAITCESCKAFFRRTALKTTAMKCYFDNNCKIDSITRKFCKKCRLDKCFDLGMNKDSILTAEKRLLWREKVEENRKKRKFTKKGLIIVEKCFNDKEVKTSNTSSRMWTLSENIDNIITTVFTSDSKSSSDVSQSSTRSNASSSVVQQNSDLYNQCCDYSYIRDNSSDNQYRDNTGVQSNVMNGQYFNSNTNSEDNSPYSASNSESTGEEPAFSTVPTKQLLISNENCIELTEYEIHLLNELSLAVFDLNYTSNSHKQIKVTSVIDDIYIIARTLASKCDKNLRKLVVMAKKIGAFKDLCSSDQMALMKSGSFDLLLLRSILAFDYEGQFNRFYIDKDNVAKVPLEVMKQFKCNVYEMQKRFLFSFIKESNNDDENILNLLMAIVLFDPDRANIIHKNNISLEKQKYVYLLQKYLITKYMFKSKANKKFLKYMNNLEGLRQLTNEHSKIFLQIDSKDVAPLLIEVLHSENEPVQ